MFIVGHVSDLHATPVVPDRVSHLLNKRFLGWLSWQIRRRRVHRTEVLDALIADLAEMAPDHMVVTGDLTNVALENEFPIARGWLERLGSPADVSLVPGNHDAYVRVPQASSWHLWSDYIVSDGHEQRRPDARRDPREMFPTLRVRGPVAVVGVCSAIPTSPLEATGTVGAGQLERLEAMLSELAARELCRLVSIHHPVSVGATIERRSLTDASDLRAVLERVGAELVVHGHNHRTLITEIAGPQRPIPVVGVRSASDRGKKPHKRAQYHLFGFERVAGDGPARFEVTLRTRGYDPTSGRFASEGEAALT